MADRDPQPFTAGPVAYRTDVYAWTKDQAALLRAQRFEAIDLDNVVEEIESLGNELAHAVESHLIVLGEHLLKLLVSADRDPRRGWRLSAAEARRSIERRLRKSPSLRRELPEMFDDGWESMREAAKGGLREAEEHLVPNDPPFNLAQALDSNFFPGEQ